MKTVITSVVLFACCLAFSSSSFADEPADDDSGALTVVVMDPLALPLSCPCVKGYAQRDYEKLAAGLKTSLKRPVKIFFNESLVSAVEKQTSGKVDLVIGKCSVVEFDAKRLHRSATKVAMLTGKDGATTQTGLIVVPKDDPAKSVADLKGYRIVFGPEECDEKHAAALALLKKDGIEAPAKLETSPACSDGACEILEAGPDVRGAAVISSYARPLLEGCGNVKKDDLRVVGETEPVPFVGAYVVGGSAAEQKQIADTLIALTADPALRLVLETQAGFVAVSPTPLTAKKK